MNDIDSDSYNLRRKFDQITQQRDFLHHDRHLLDPPQIVADDGLHLHILLVVFTQRMKAVTAMSRPLYMTTATWREQFMLRAFICSLIQRASWKHKMDMDMSHNYIELSDSVYKTGQSDSSTYATCRSADGTYDPQTSNQSDVTATVHILDL